MTQTISTIVDDRIVSLRSLLRLYDPNNFYYCRSLLQVFCPSSEVYMTQTISTIVDILYDMADVSRLYDPNNFYYCRLVSQFCIRLSLYDPNNFYYCRCHLCHNLKLFSLYDPNNFYYCRCDVVPFLQWGVYMTQTISTIVDPSWWRWRTASSLYDPNNFYYCRCMTQHKTGHSLYDPNNFYYCRSLPLPIPPDAPVYMTQTISTIVDYNMMYRLL